MNAARWSLLVLSGTLAAGLCLAAQPAQAPRPPNKWLREAAAFNALPPESQRRIRQLDRQLREEDSETRDRYLQLLQRYNSWVERLSAAQRRSIEEAPTNQAKIKQIRALKEQQWISTLPKADRDPILDPGITAQERQQRIAAARTRAEQTELDWQMTLARLEERQDFLRSEFIKWREQVLAKLEPSDRRARLQEWKNFRQPGVLAAMLEMSLKLNVPVPELFAYPPVDHVRLRQFIQQNPQVLAEFEARLRDPEQREIAFKQLIGRYWEQHPAELRALRTRDRLIRERKGKP